MIKLSDVAVHGELVSDGLFAGLGQSDSNTSHTLAYCDSIFHLRRALANASVSCLISTPELIARCQDASGASNGSDYDCGVENRGLVSANNPRLRFFELHEFLARQQLLQLTTQGRIGKDCTIHPTAVISEQAVIGDKVSIGANVVIHDHVSIGSGTSIDSGAQVGVDGLLYYVDEQGCKRHVRHQGGVRIGRHCALLCNSVIVRSVHGGLLTQIHDHCVIGIGSNIGHEAHIENNVIISNHCVIARAAQIRQACHVGTSSVIREYVTLHEQASVKPGSIVVDDVEAGHTVSGNYAVNHRTRMRQFAARR